MRSGRVVVLSDYIGGDGPGSGGAGHAALDSFRALRAAGVEVRAIAGFGTASAIDADRFASLNGADLRSGNAVDTLRAIYNPAARSALTAALAGENPDTTLIILHQWTRYLSPAALAIVGRFPTMVYMHDYFWPCPNGIYYDFKAQRPCDRQPMGLRCLGANCDRQGRVQKAGRVARQGARRVLTRSGPSRRLFLHLSERALRTAAPLLPGERHAILHNPLPVPETPPDPPPQPRYAVGYFGRLEPDKGVGALLDTVLHDGLTGLFVGQGSLEERLVDAKIEHRTWQPRTSMPAAMRACAAVVLPSLWNETWGLIVPEAMAAGVPVLVSSRAGSSELVRRFGGGATFDPGRPGDLSEKLAAMRAARPAPTTMQTELRTFLSPERHAARIVALAASQFGLDLRANSQRTEATPLEHFPQHVG